MRLRDRVWLRGLMQPDDGGGAAGAGAGAGGAAAGAAGAGAPAPDAAALKAANERLAGELATLKGQLSETTKSLEALKSLNPEDSRKQVDALSKKLGDYELREKRGAALQDAVSKATEFTVDVDKARKYVERVATTPESVEGAVKEAVELFGVKKAAPGAGAAGAAAGAAGQQQAAAGAQRGFSGQPADGQGAGDSAERVNLGTLYRTNPEAYKAKIAEGRKNIPFLNQ